MPETAQKQTPKNEKLEQAKQSFIQGAGQISVSLLGILNRVCGQIYALLFVSPEPFSLDDIVEELGVSKGNVSINIRVLEDYKLVKKVWVKGSRRDYYQAVDALPTKVIKEFIEKMKRNVQDSLDMVTDCQQQVERTKKECKGEDKETAEFMLEKLKRIQSFYRNANLLFEAIYSGQKLDTSVLKPILTE